MPLLTNPQVATLQRILAVANEVLPKLELLESLASINPNLATRVRELRAQREYLVSLATAALEIDRQIPAGTTGAGFPGKGADVPTFMPSPPVSMMPAGKAGGGGGGSGNSLGGTTYVYWAGTIPQDVDKELSKLVTGGASFDQITARWRVIARESNVPAILALWPGFFVDR